MASTAATLAVAGLILPYAHDGRRAGPLAAGVPAVSGPRTCRRRRRVASRRPPARTDAGQDAGPTGTKRYGGPGLTVPSLPALPELPLPTPDIPDVSPVPKVPVPDLTVPDLSSAPDLPAVPDVPAVPDLPTASDLSSTPLPKPPLPTDAPEANTSVPQVPSQP